MTPGAGLVLPDADGGPSEVARLYARYLAGCYQRFFELGTRLPENYRNDHRRSLELVQLAWGRERRQMLACFASPTIGTPLHCAGLRDRLPELADRIEAATRQIIPHLMLEMSLRRLLREGETFAWRHRPTALTSLSAGYELRPPAGSDGLCFANGALQALRGEQVLAATTLPPTPAPPASAAEFEIVRRYWRGDGARLAEVDGNPIAAFEAHPDKSGNHVDLGGRSAGEWLAMTDSCFRLIGEFLPGERAEMATLLHQLVPVGYDETRHLSASYREAVGTVYLTLHPNVMTMTEALIHEFQHNKLNVASYSMAFLRNAFEPLYRSPIRPDPRPLWGILLAVHAFLPVAELYRRMRAAEHPLSRQKGFDERLDDIDLKNHEGMEMLRHNAQLTPAGEALMAALERLAQQHLADRRARGLGLTPTDVHLG
ncbi:MAG TPA: HEXXH motif-containing putative peptide modification protein [Terriglobales bacterium]|nr:HEXXH motif-containing putative peptide modification protein [Terriglobales bacterium]